MNYLLLLFISLFSFPHTAEKFDLKVTVTNVKSLKGNVEIGIFNNSKNFLIEGKAYRTASKVVTGDKVVFIFKDLVKDDYAVSLFHDVNADKKCNLNFLGIPKEPYGFSQNFKPKLSKPSFNDCKVEVNGDKSITIKLL